jgi:putative transposase
MPGRRTTHRRASEVSKCAAQEAFRDLDRAFASFRRGREAGRTVGFPKFKKKGAHDSCRFSTGAIRALGPCVQLPRLGRIRVKEATRVEGRILSATVSRDADRWFVSFTVERHRPDPASLQGPVVGIDLGVNCFAVLSDGERIESPRPLQRSLRRLRRLSRQHSRKQRGSCNRRKSAVRLARLHRRVRNQRRDFLHKATTRLSKTKRVIVIEDLCISGMTRSARGAPRCPGRRVRAKSGLNRSRGPHSRFIANGVPVLDQGWGEFG